MRLAFLGSPAFAVQSLRSLHAAGHEVRLVVTRPDRPRGRGRRPAATAVKEVALELGLPVCQPDSVNSAEARDALAACGAELGVVVAYGEILRPGVLAVLPNGFLNVHASLLPDYRGAAPIHWALIRGETETGVTVIRMEPALDAGPILAARRLAIGPAETAGELHDRLAVAGAELLTGVVDRLSAGREVPGRPQAASGGFFARSLTKADGWIEWSATAEDVCNRVRGLTPWPGACTLFRHDDRRGRVLLLRAEAAPVGDPEAEPGTVLEVSPEAICVQAGRGLVSIKELKPAGGRAMTAGEFARGHPVEPGDRFGGAPDDP